MSVNSDQTLLVNESEEESFNKYWDSGLGGAGCLFLALDTGRLLFAHRSNSIEFEPNTWGTWGGKIDDGETPEDAVMREVEEESKFSGKYKILPLWTFKDSKHNFKYYNFLVIVSHEFSPQLNWENDNFIWVKYGDWPSPLHFGVSALLKHSGNMIKKFINSKVTSKKLSEATDVPPAIVQYADATKSSQKMAPKSMINAYVVVATIWKEARGEGERGMQAVLNVIMNRAKGDFSKAKDVVTEPYQFEVWNGINNPIQASIELAKKSRNDPSFQTAMSLVDKAMKGKLSDVTQGATFYFNPKKVTPSWAKKMVKTKSIGNHDFYKLPTTSTKQKNLTKLNELQYSINSSKTGLIDDGIYGYTLSTPFSYIRYGYEPSTNIFYLLNVATPNSENQNKGYAKELLIYFFKLIKSKRGSLDHGSYTTSGMTYIKPVVDRLSKDYNVRLVNGKEL